jgi:spermidine synthase
MLEPNGLLVVNLHSRHEHFPVYLERIKKIFAGNVVTVSEPEHGNIIAFAFASKELPAAQLRANLRLCASTLAPEAWTQLAPSFSMIKQFGKWHRQNTS